MTQCTLLLHNLLHLYWHAADAAGRCRTFPAPLSASTAALAAENLFLRKQLALYQERHVKPRRATDATRLALVWLARWFDWRQALAVVQPATLTPLASPGVPALLALEVHAGRPPLPADLQALIRRMAR